MEKQLELFGDDHRKEELKLEKVVTCKKCGCQKTIEEMKNLDHNSCFVEDKNESERSSFDNNIFHR